MRNLTSTFSDFWHYDAATTAGSSYRITKTTVNPEDNTLYVLSEKKDGSGMVELEVLKACMVGTKRSLQVNYRALSSSSCLTNPELFDCTLVDLHARSPGEQLLPDFRRRARGRVVQILG